MKIDFIPSIKFLTLGLCAMLVPYGPVNAQSEGKILEEVIVTANKIEQNIRDVGTTITVKSYDEMQMRQILSLEDLAAAIPGLSYSRSALNTPVYSLRGVGFNDLSLGVYPSVSVYQDEALLTFPAMSTHSAFDLERVEVLKGPQGTLFGQNSTGGAINYIAAKPTDEFSTGITGTYGRFDLIDVEAFVSGPLSENLKGRAAVKYRNANDWQTSTSRGDGNGSEDLLIGKVILEWEPTDNLRISGSVNVWKDESDPQAMQFSALNVNIPETVQDSVRFAPFPDLTNRAADWSVVDPATGAPFDMESDIDSIHTTGRIDWDFSDNLRFTSLTSYIDYERKAVNDADGIAGESYDFRQAHGTAESLTQEFRLENTNTENYRWIVGVNYEDSETDEDLLLEYDEDSSSNADANFISVSGLRAINKMKNWAVFGNLNYRLTDRISAKVGIRYTDAEFEHDNCNYAANENLAELFNILGDIFSGPGTFTPIEVGDCYTLNEEGVPGELFEETLKEDNVSWKVGLDFEMTDDVMLYFNVSQGYKQGSFPSTAAATFVQFEPVVQESILAFEGGVKAVTMDGRMQFNAAAFYYQFDDKQIRGRIDDPIFGILEVLRNIPESEITGFEADVTFLPVEGLTLRAALTYTDTEVTKSPEGAINDLGEPTDFTGSELPFAPPWQFQLDGQYEWVMNGNGFKPFIGFTFNFSDDTMSILNGDKSPVFTADNNRTVPGGLYPFVIDSYNTLDLRLGVISPDERWTVFAWGKNVTDEYYWTNVLIGADTLGRLTGRPATYGITFSYSY